MTAVSDIARCVLTGGVIAYPTEGVFGLGCDPANEAALHRIIEIKGRDAHKGFIVIAGEVSELDSVIKPLDLSPLNTEIKRTILNSWPGPHTWVVPAKSNLPAILTGHRDTLAVRVTLHPVVRDICAAIGGPLVSTSANRSGQQPLQFATDVIEQFGEAVDLVVNKPVTSPGKPSSITDARTGQVLR